MKKLGDSLLARSAKVTDLMSKLESHVQEKPEGSMEKKRVTRPGLKQPTQNHRCFFPISIPPFILTDQTPLAKDFEVT